MISLMMNIIRTVSFTSLINQLNLQTAQINELNNKIKAKLNKH